MLWRIGHSDLPGKPVASEGGVSIVWTFKIIGAIGASGGSVPSEPSRQLATIQLEQYLFDLSLDSAHPRLDAGARRDRAGQKPAAFHRFSLPPRRGDWGPDHQR